MSQGFPPQPPPNYYPAPPQRPGMSTGAKIALGIVISGCVIMGGCFACASLIWQGANRNLNSNSAVSDRTSPGSAPGSPQPSDTAASSRTTWQYSESEDRMTNQKTKTAFVISSNTVEFAFPYGGELHASLILRKKRGSDNVILKIEKGQLTCGDYSRRSVSVRFDEGPARRFSVSEAADHSSTTVFINNEKSFIAEAKKAKKIRIEAIVYQNGSPIFEFDTAGLNLRQTNTGRAPRKANVVYEAKPHSTTRRHNMNYRTR